MVLGLNLKLWSPTTILTIFIKKKKIMIINYSFYNVNTHMNKIYITLKIILKIKLFYEFFVLKKSFLPKTSISTQ